jgi:transcriptional regulator with XRE-family HTH domain
MERGWSQRQVSLQTGLTEQTVFNWEQGRSLPSYDGLKKLVKASHISADWWLGLTDHR